MPEKQEAPRRISTRSASTDHSASLDAEKIRRAVESSQSFGVPGAAPSAPARPAAPARRSAAASGARQDTAPLFATEHMFYDQFNDPDFPPDKNGRAKKSGRGKATGRGDTVLWLLIFVFSAMLLVSGGVLVKRYLDDRKTQNDFASLQSLIATPEEAPEATQSPDRFAALRARNDECVGWISINYTELSYPVMYSPTRPDFYLKHDFDGNYSDYGVPYLDEDCTLTAESRSNNLIIYGHNMKTGIIFRPLTGYLEKDFYTVHPTVHLDTLYDSSEYEVFAAFEIDVVQDPDFIYNEYYDMDEQTFDWFVNEVISRSPVDSGIRPVYGDDLLTLSTCEYTTDNGRMVVCARRVREDTGSADINA